MRRVGKQLQRRLTARVNPFYWSALIQRGTAHPRTAAVEDSDYERPPGSCLVSPGRAVHAMRSGRRSPAMGSSGRVAVPGPQRGAQQPHRTRAADIPAIGADVDRAAASARSARARRTYDRIMTDT